MRTGPHDYGPREWGVWGGDQLKRVAFATLTNLPVLTGWPTSSCWPRTTSASAMLVRIFSTGCLSSSGIFPYSSRLTGLTIFSTLVQLPLPILE